MLVPLVSRGRALAVFLLPLIASLLFFGFSNGGSLCFVLFYLFFPLGVDGCFHY